MARRNRTEAVVADDAKKAAQLTGKASRGQARLPVFTGRARGFGSDPREAQFPIRPLNESSQVETRSSPVAGRVAVLDARGWTETSFPRNQSPPRWERALAFTTEPRWCHLNAAGRHKDEPLDGFR